MTFSLYRISFPRSVMIMKKILLRGFIGLSPILICIVLVVCVIKQLDWIFGTPIALIFGENIYFPGVGVIIGLIILFLMGLLLNNWVMQNLYNWFEKILRKIPLLKTIYTSITDLMSFFNTGQTKEMGRVVMVDYKGIKMLGLVTRETFDDLPEGIGKNHEDVAVFFPFSYQIGGMTMIVPKSSIKSIDMSIEKGLRFSVTAANPSADRSTFSPKKQFRKKN